MHLHHLLHLVHYQNFTSFLCHSLPHLAFAPLAHGLHATIASTSLNVLEEVLQLCWNCCSIGIDKSNQVRIKPWTFKLDRMGPLLSPWLCCSLWDFIFSVLHISRWSFALLLEASDLFSKTATSLANNLEPKNLWTKHLQINMQPPNPLAFKRSRDEPSQCFLSFAPSMTAWAMPQKSIWDKFHPKACNTHGTWGRSREMALKSSHLFLPAKLIYDSFIYDFICNVGWTIVKRMQ